METKERVLEILENSDGESVSGETLATELNVSRNAVWKAVSNLRKEGYEISAGTNKGYSLDKMGDILSASAISKYLKGNAKKCRIECRKCVISTNTVLREMAALGEAEFKVLAAESQTGGKGRKGRNFFSPEGQGIYFSILLRPKLAFDKALYITTAAAAAVTEAVKNITNIDTDIKWVNDVYLNGKKICGILTEASMDCENGVPEYAVLGIGINLYSPKDGYPTEIDKIATSLYNNESYDNTLRIKLLAEVLNVFLSYYQNLEQKPFMDAYRKKSFVIGKEIETIINNEAVTAKVTDIDDEARLIVKKGNETLVLSAGEISIKVK